MTGKTWTISNILSISRLVLVVPIAVLLLSDRQEFRHWIVGMMVLAVLTDTMDGALARALHQESELGRILDPLADKIAVAVIAAVLTVEGIIPLWFFLVALLRDLLILTGGLYIKARKQIVLQSNTLGKWTVTVMAAYIIVSTLQIENFNTIRTFLLIVSTLMIIGSFAVYAQRFFQEMRVA